MGGRSDRRCATRGGLVVLAIGVLLGACAVALADSGGADDPGDDVSGPVDGPKRDSDFLSASFRHLEGGDLRHEAIVRGTITRFPVLEIDIEPRDGQCDYFIARVGPAPRKPRIVNCETRERKGVDARVVGDDTVRYTFAAAKIGSPGEYGWRFLYEQEGSDEIADAVPNSGFADHCNAAKRFCF